MEGCPNTNPLSTKACRVVLDKHSYILLRFFTQLSDTDTHAYLSLNQKYASYHVIMCVTAIAEAIPSYYTPTNLQNIPEGAYEVPV